MKRTEYYRLLSLYIGNDVYTYVRSVGELYGPHTGPVRIIKLRSV